MKTSAQASTEGNKVAKPQSNGTLTPKLKGPEVTGESRIGRLQLAAPRRLWQVHALLILAIQSYLLAALAGCGSPSPPSQDAAGVQGAAPSPGVRVAAAADLKFVLPELIAAFGRQHPNSPVTVTYGSSGNFFAQLSNEAPFDLFLSADMDYPLRLIAAGQGLAGSEFQYAVGRIVVWVRNDSPLDLESRGMDALADPLVKKLAIAHPQHAPYGRAAEAALLSLGLYEALAPRLALGENVAQAAQFVESGAADAGIIALSLAVAPPLRDRGRFLEVPQDAYLPLVQGGCQLTWSQDALAAGEFRKFLRNLEGRAILREYGFVLPDEPDQGE